MKTKNRYYNPNPLKKETGDCVIRAMCKATEQEWDSVYKQLFEIGFEIKELPNQKPTWVEFLKRNNFIKHSIKVKKGSKRPTVDSFSRSHRQGTFVLQVANHIVTVQDGYYYDIWDCGDRSLYTYYEKVD